MNTPAQIAKRFREILLDGDWVAGTNYKAQLKEIDWQLALKKMATCNTIAALTFHIHYYINGVIPALQGGPLAIHDKFSFDLPPIETKKDWDELLTQLWNDVETFANLVELLPEEKLQEDFVDKKYGTYQRNLDGLIEHCYYHLGQIVLLKKILTQT